MAPIAPDKILSSDEIAQVKEGTEKKVNDAVTAKTVNTLLTSDTDILAAFAELKTMVAGKSEHEKQRVQKEIEAIVSNELGRAVLLERKFAGLKPEEKRRILGETDFTKTTESEQRKEIIEKYLWDANFKGKTDAQKKKLGEIALKEMSKDDVDALLKEELAVGLSPDDKYKLIGQNIKDFEMSSVQRREFVINYLIGAYNAGLDPLTEPSYKTLSPAKRATEIRNHSAIGSLADDLLKLGEFTCANLTNPQVDIKVGEIKLKSISKDKKIEILGNKKHAELGSEVEVKKVIMEKVLAEDADTDAKQKVLLGLASVRYTAKEKNGMLLDHLWNKISGDGSAEQIKTELEKVISEARLTVPSGAGKSLDDLIAAATGDLKDQLKLIKTIRDASRESQKESRWAKVEVKGGKYRWVTKEGQKAWQKGYEGYALLGEVKSLSKELPLSPAEEIEYADYLLGINAEKTAFYGMLKDIGSISINAVKASGPGGSEYLKEEARKFFNTLSATRPTTGPVKLSQQEIFAKYEGLLLDGAYDPDACAARILAYLNEAFGKKGKYVETALSLPTEEKEKILDNLDNAENLIDEIASISTPPATVNDTFLKKVKAAISTSGAGGATNKALYLKYIYLRPKFGNLDATTMIYSVEYMLQLRAKGVTSNAVPTPSGFKSAEGLWKISDHPAEFKKDMATYREFMGFMRKEFPTATPGELRAKLKKMCEEFRTGGEGKDLMTLLDKYKPGFGETTIAELYKAILMFEKTVVDLKALEFDETGGVGPMVTEMPDIEDKDLKALRDDYAKKRRKIRKFFKSTKEADIAVSRDLYKDGVSKRILHTITSDPSFGAMQFMTGPDRDAFKVEVRKKTVQELLKERKVLLVDEMKIHKASLWEKMKTGFRKHPGLRLVVSGALLGGTIAGGAIWGAPVAVPLILAKAGWMGVNTQVAWEGGFETIQNKLGATRGKKPLWIKKLGVDASTMDETESRERLAAHTALSVGRKPGFTKGNPTVGPLPKFFDSDVAKDIWDKNREHTSAAIDTAIAAMPADATKDQIIAETIKVGIAEEAKFMESVEKRERHLRTTDIIKKLSGLVLAVGVASYSLVSDLPKTTPAPTPAPGPTPGPTPTPGPHPAPGPSPVVPPPEPTVVPPPEPVTPGPIPGPTPGPVPADLTFKMIDSMPGDIDPGVLQAMPFKFGLSGSEASQLQTYIANHNVLGGMESLNPFVTGRPGITDAHGAFQQGINFVKPDEVFRIPDGANFVNEVMRITGGRLSPAEIARRLAN